MSLHNCAGRALSITSMNVVILLTHDLPAAGAHLARLECCRGLLLFMFYLNDVEEGGSTDFYYQDASIQPKAGRMVIAPAYFTHTHRGQIPVSNDKYILTSWVLFNRAEQLYG